MIYDMIVVGGGPAGLTACIYALRANKKVLLIERYMPGGQVAITNEIKNYPGFESIDGITLSTKMFMHASSYGLEMVVSDVTEFMLDGEIKKVKTYDGTFEAKTIILCLGASKKEMSLENEKKFLGRGVSYCATCDGNFYKGKTVAVVGGGNVAVEEALYLSNLASKVYLIHRRDELRAEAIEVEKLDKSSNIEKKYGYIVSSLNGGDRLESINIINNATKKEEKLEVDGIFIAIGRTPDTDLIKDKLNLENGYIVTDEKMATNISGVFAAGDVRKTSLRQIVTACSDGAIAATSANMYIQKMGVKL